MKSLYTITLDRNIVHHTLATVYSNQLDTILEEIHRGVIFMSTHRYVYNIKREDFIDGSWVYTDDILLDASLESKGKYKDSIDVSMELSRLIKLDIKKCKEV